MISELDERARRQNIEIGGGPRRLRAASGRTNQPQAARVGGDRRRQHARHRAHRPVEREFADDGVAVQRVGRNRADRRHDAERDRQIVVTALFGQVGGREIDGDAPRRQRETRGDQRGAHPLAQFGDRLVAEADDHERDVAAGDLHLDIDGASVDAFERHCRNARNHIAPARSSPAVRRLSPRPSEREHLQNIAALARVFRMRGVIFVRGRDRSGQPLAAARIGPAPDVWTKTASARPRSARRRQRETLGLAAPMAEEDHSRTTSLCGSVRPAFSPRWTATSMTPGS